MVKSKTTDRKSGAAVLVHRMVRLPIKHLGYVTPICGANAQPEIRADLEYARCKRLGKSERFKDEPPYQICGRCLAVKRRAENNFRKLTGRRLVA